MGLGPHIPMSPYNRRDNGTVCRYTGRGRSSHGQVVPIAEVALSEDGIVINGARDGRVHAESSRQEPGGWYLKRIGL